MVLINKESLNFWMKRYSYSECISLLNESDNYQYDQNGNAVVVYNSTVGTPDEKHLINRNGKDMIVLKENGQTIYPKIICPAILCNPITYDEVISGKRKHEHIDIYIVSFDKRYFHYVLYDNHCNEIVRDCQVHQQHGFEISYIEKISDNDRYHLAIEPKTNECLVLKRVFCENGIIIGKTEDERYFVLTQDTNSIIIFPGDIYQFDEFHINPLAYGCFSVRVGNKCNILDFCGELPNKKYCQFLFDEWVDDILRIGSHLIVKKGNTNYIADGDLCDGINIIPFDEIYKAVNDNIIINYKDKWNVLRYRDKNGKYVPELLDDKWFDGMYDFGTSYETDDEYDDDLSPCPIVERDGKYTYICIGGGIRMFPVDFDYLFDEWFDECEPCYRDEDDGRWKFPVEKNGRKFVLNEFGKIDEKCF